MIYFDLPGEFSLTEQSRGVARTTKASAVLFGTGFSFGIHDPVKPGVRRGLVDDRDLYRATIRLHILPCGKYSEKKENISMNQVLAQAGFCAEPRGERRVI